MLPLGSNSIKVQNHNSEVQKKSKKMKTQKPLNIFPKVLLVKFPVLANVL